METPKTQLSSALRSAGRKRSGRRPRHCARSAIRGAWDAALALCAGCPRKCARGRGGLTWLPAVSAGMSSRSTASPLRRRRCGNSSRAAGLWRRRRRARHTAMRPSRSPWTTSSRRRFALRGASGAAAGRDTVLCLRHRSGDGGVAKTAALAFRWRLARVVRFKRPLERSLQSFRHHLRWEDLIHCCGRRSRLQCYILSPRQGHGMAAGRAVGRAQRRT